MDRWAVHTLHLRKAPDVANGIHRDDHGRDAARSAGAGPRGGILARKTDKLCGYGEAGHADERGREPHRTAP